jgi:hypothetical protein
VEGDVLDMSRSTLSFWLRNDDRGYSHSVANSPLNQDPRALGVGRPILVQVGIPKSGIARTGALQCRMYLELPDVVRRWSSHCGLG